MSFVYAEFAQKTRNKTFNEEDVIQDAMQLFWKEGFHSTSIQDLVQHLGINRASLYDTYGDKEGLFKKCYTLYRSIVESKFNEIFTNNKNYKAAFNKLFKFIINEICVDNEHRGCFITNTYSELLPKNNHNMHKELSDTQEFFTSLLKEKLLLAKKNNSISKDTNVNKLALSIYSSLVGITILSKMHLDRDILLQSLDHYLDLFN